MTNPPHPQPAHDTVIETSSIPRKRPFGVTLFLWMVLSLSVWGLLRFFAVQAWRGVLTEFHASLSPRYLSITGAIWAVVGGMLLWSIWAGKRWAHPAIPISIVIWLVEYWIERIFFEAPRANLPFMIAVSLVLLGVTLASTFDRKTRNFLLKSEEHEQSEEYPNS